MTENGEDGPEVLFLILSNSCHGIFWFRWYNWLRSQGGDWEGAVVRSFLVGTFLFIVGVVPLQAASTFSGNPLNYQPVSLQRADAALQDIRSRSLNGNLTDDDILKAAEQIKAVRQNADASPVASPSVAEAVPAEAPSSGYMRVGTDLQIPVDDTASPLNGSQRSQLNQTLDRLPLRQLFLIQQIQVSAPVTDPDRGQLVVQTQGSRLTIYGTQNIAQGVTEGAAAIVYESLRGTPMETEWQTHGDFAEFVQTYADWVNNTEQAFAAVKGSEQPTEDLSKLFFVASLFTDNSLNRTTTYDPAPKDEAWQVQDNSYAFGPIAFQVYHNQIVHSTDRGVLLTASAATIPSLWTRQGLGN